MSRFDIHLVMRSLGILILLAAVVHAEPAGSTPASPSADYVVDPASVERYGAGYRYPQAGWTVLHIEGAPYERGYQHGRLLSHEISDYIATLAADRSTKAPADSWHDYRLIVNALFLRRFEPEFLEEMKGIADGAAAAGAKFENRPLDLLDVVAVNSAFEMDFLETGLDALPTGLEGKKFAEPLEGHPKANPPDHCSAFAATGPATADGKIVFGHITMWNLLHVRHYNVWLDVKPVKGHRVLMQTYPGGIMSGMDYYLNDAGLLVAETTIRQTRFNIEGTALCSRIRKVLQYASGIDDAVEILKQANNGLYSNEWLLADINTNEIAMFELGTHKHRLWRSSKNEWIAGTEGFYWGCNNAKDLAVRLETVPSMIGKPANVLYRPSERDKKWISLYQKNKGKIAAGFGFEAFTTPPLAAFPSCDAKFTTTALAKELKTWALFGPPLGRTWDATPHELKEYDDIQALVANDWTLLTALPPPGVLAPAATLTAATTAKVPGTTNASGTPQVPAAAKVPEPVAVDLSPKAKPKESAEGSHRPVTLPPAWHGTLLPAADADLWLAAGFSNFEKIVAQEKLLLSKAKEGRLSEDDLDQLAVRLFAHRSHWFAATKRLGRDVPLLETVSDPARNEWFDIAAGKGTLLLAELRQRLGAAPFEKLMDEFGRAHGGKTVSTDQFLKHVHAAAASAANGLFDPWLKGSPQGAPAGGWAVDSFEVEPEQTLIIYGTVSERAAQQEAAILLQRKIARRGGNFSLTVKTDADVTDDDLKSHHLLLVGRPDTNSVTARLADAWPMRFGPHSFRLRDKTYAHADSAVVVAGGNPRNPRYSAVAIAGLSAAATWHIPGRLPEHGGLTTEVFLLAAGSEPKSLIVSAPPYMVPPKEPEKKDVPRTKTAAK